MSIFDVRVSFSMICRFYRSTWTLMDAWSIRNSLNSDLNALNSLSSSSKWVLKFWGSSDAHIEALPNWFGPSVARLSMGVLGALADSLSAVWDVPIASSVLIRCWLWCACQAILTVELKKFSSLKKCKGFLGPHSLVTKCKLFEAMNLKIGKRLSLLPV